MKWNQAFETKDQMIKQALYDIFRDDEETMSRIDQAFQDGKQNWIRHMRNIFGTEDSEKLVAALGRDV
jgi:hypothetical protein